MEREDLIPILQRIQQEELQGHATRRQLYLEIEKYLGRPVIAFFTSFRFPVMIETQDADVLECVLQKMDLSSGLALVINSPGGDGLAAERIINICRTYSGTGEYWAIVPSKAKSAATMICFGASKIIMSRTSELGCIDPQVIIPGEKGVFVQRFSAYNVIESYRELFERAIKETGNLQPYLQQLANYDEREIRELEAACLLSEDIAIRALKSCMMRNLSEEEIKQKIEIFLTPRQTKAHGRPIYASEVSSCGLNVEVWDNKEERWRTIYELYIRIDHLVSTSAAKCVETKDHAFVARAPKSVQLSRRENNG